jgi:hypothetical protein
MPAPADRAEPHRLRVENFELRMLLEKIGNVLLIAATARGQDVKGKLVLGRWQQIHGEHCPIGGCSFKRQSALAKRIGVGEIPYNLPTVGRRRRSVVIKCDHRIASIRCDIANSRGPILASRVYPRRPQSRRKPAATPSPPTNDNLVTTV